MGFSEQFEPIGNLLCDPHPSPAVGGRHLPLRGRQARGDGSFLFKKSVFSFWYQQKEGFPHTLAFPWGKVPTSPCGGRRMRVTVPISARFRQHDKPKFEKISSHQNIFQNLLDIFPKLYYNYPVMRNALTGNLPAMSVQRAAVWCEAVGQATSLTPERLTRKGRTVPRSP